MNRILENETKSHIKVTFYYSKDRQPTHWLFAGHTLPIESEDIEKLTLKFSVPVDISVNTFTEVKKFLGGTGLKNQKAYLDSITETGVSSNVSKIKVKAISKPKEEVKEEQKKETKVEAKKEDKKDVAPKRILEIVY